MEETKITMSVSRKKAIEAHVKMIMQHNEKKFDKAIDKRKEFSDYVIKKIVGDFMNDVANMKDEKNNKLNLAHELYLQYMEVWEDMDSFGKYAPKEVTVFNKRTKKNQRKQVQKSYFSRSWRAYVKY